MTSTTIETIAPGQYRITGTRISGRMDARIDITPARYRDNDDQIDVTLTVPVGEELTVNGIGISGYTRVRANGHAPFRYASGGYLHRTPTWEGTVTDSARRQISDAAVQVAKLFYSPERLQAARVRDAEHAVQRAEAEAAEAEARAQAARDALSALQQKGA